MGNDRDILMVLSFWGQILEFVVLMRVSDISQMLIYFLSSDTVKYIGSQIFKMQFFKKIGFILYQIWTSIRKKNPLSFGIFKFWNRRRCL